MLAAVGKKEVLRKSDLESRLHNRLTQSGQTWQLQQQQQKIQLIVGDILQTIGIHSLNMAWLAIQICGREFTGLQIAASYSAAGPQQNVQRQYKKHYNTKQGISLLSCELESYCFIFYISVDNI